MHKERLGHRKADWTTQLQVVVADITVSDIAPETLSIFLFLEGRNLHGAKGSQNARSAWLSKKVEGGLQGTADWALVRSPDPKDSLYYTLLAL